MDFELKSLSHQQAAKLPVDALLVLVPDGADVSGTAGAALVSLIREANRRGDLEPGVGKALSCYRPQDIKASWVVLVRSGDGSASAVRKAVLAGMGLLKQPGVKKLGLLLSLLDQDALNLPPAKPCSLAWSWPRNGPTVPPTTPRPACWRTPRASWGASQGSGQRCWVRKKLQRLAWGLSSRWPRVRPSPCASSSCITAARPRPARLWCSWARASHSIPAASPSSLRLKWMK